MHVQDASVEFIRRGGNAYRGQKLFVKDEKPIVIPQDLSEERLKHVYWDILSTAKEIEKFYKVSRRSGALPPPIDAPSSPDGGSFILNGINL